MTGERRDAERVAILGHLHGELMVYEPMSVQDIGVDGVTVDTAFPLRLDSLHELRLVLGAQTVVLKGRVVHSRIIDVDQEMVVYRSGLEFVEPSERVGAVIAEFVAGLKASRRGGSTAT